MESTLTPEQLNKRRPPFVVLLGIQYTKVSHDSLEAEMLVRDDMCTPHETCHGGAMMTFADTMGAVSTVVNMPRDARTMTMESKTNFLRGAPMGQKLYGKTFCVHQGSRTQVWRTEITREDGKLAASVTQTQMVIPAG
jgi:uncharacterized protein (TIGR00369 family)